MRARILRISFKMSVETLASTTGPGSPKAVIDSYVAAQQGSVKYGYKDGAGPIAHMFQADLSIPISTRSEAATKMDQIESNLELLPPISELKYNYIETERFVLEQPETEPEE
jgi:hypothetical protein